MKQVFALSLTKKDAAPPLKFKVTLFITPRPNSNSTKCNYLVSHFINNTNPKSPNTKTSSHNRKPSTSLKSKYSEQSSVFSYHCNCETVTHYPVNKPVTIPKSS
uniref:Uncharacterized protein n=1 Tax=Opuntia streptacantha TaxID=393608 RepID=A0A7C9DXB3_OPUST